MLSRTGLTEATQERSVDVLKQVEGEFKTPKVSMMPRQVKLDKDIVRIGMDAMTEKTFLLEEKRRNSVTSNDVEREAIKKLVKDGIKVRSNSETEGVSVECRKSSRNTKQSTFYKTINFKDQPIKPNKFKK